MPADFGLVNPQIPLKVDNFQIDPSRAQANALSMAEGIGEFQNNQMVRQNEINDQQAIKDYLGSGGDFYTPEGMGKALTDLKGKVSPDMYMKLGKTAQDVRLQHQQELLNLQKMDDNALTLFDKQQDNVLKYLNAPIEAYDKALTETKNPSEALKVFHAARQQAIDSASKEVGADGKPIYSPQVLQRFQNSSPDDIRTFRNATQWHRDLVDAELKRRHTEAQTRELNARSKFEEKYKMPSGLDPRAKLAWENEHGIIDNATMQAGLKDIQSKTDYNESRAKIYSGISGLDSGAIDDAAAIYLRDGKIPPSFTRGAGGQAAAMQIMNRAHQMLVDQGKTAEANALEQDLRKAQKPALAQIEKEKTQTVRAERTLQSNMKVATDLMNKVDNTGIPVLNRWINAGRKSIKGDADVAAFDAAISTAISDYSQVMANSSKPTNMVRSEAHDLISSKSSPDQIKAVFDTWVKDADGKLKSYDQGIEDLKRDLSSNNESKKLSRDLGTITYPEGPSGGSSSQENSSQVQANIQRIDSELKNAKTPEQRKALLQERRSLANSLSSSSLGGLSVGKVVNGYRYNGGDPNSQSSWSKV